MNFELPLNCNNCFKTTDCINSMDPKKVNYSPVTFLNLERQYLSSIVSGNYSETLPTTFRGQRLDAWGQLH